MRTILDTSTGYGTACVIDVKGGGDKYVISSAVSFLRELGKYTRFRCRTDPELAIKAMVDAVIKCLSDDRAVEQILPEETIPESHASLGALEGWHNLLQGQIRALRLDVEDRFGSIVGVTHQCGCVNRWLQRRQATGGCVNRFERSVRQETIGAVHDSKMVERSVCNESRTNMILVGELEFGWTTLCIRRTLDWNSWWCHTSQNSATTDA